MSSVVSRRRIILLLVGMFLMALGIAALTSARVGTTPVSALPLVTGEIVGITLGAATFFVNVVFVGFQILVLRSRFRLLSLVQIPLVFLFGVFIDINMHWVGVFFGDNYLANLALSVFSNLFLALGLIGLLAADISMMPADGFVLALALTLHGNFGTLKIAFDVTTVILSAALGFFILGAPVGIREGTLISAFAVGYLVKKLTPTIRPRLIAFLRKN